MFQHPFNVTEEVAILLGGTILLDTVNLDEKAGRVTDADNTIAELPLPLCPLSRHEFYDNIQRDKFKAAGLCTDDLLRKEYKEFQFDTVRCGIGLALLPISQWQAMDKDLFSGFISYARTHNLDVLLPINAFANPDLSTDLVVYCTTKKAHDALVVYFQKHSLDLTPRDHAGFQQQESNGFLSCHHQGNLAISRKKLQPLFAEYYEETFFLR